MSADAMTQAALAWIDSLDDGQREAAVWPFPSDDERTQWFYTPTDHGGLTLDRMTPGQRGLALRLLASGLSRAGYVTVATIMGLENVLDMIEGWRQRMPGRERTRDPGMYYVRVFGTPADRGAWSWRFGGHHVSINHLVVDGSVRASTPCFMGADPASVPLLGPHLLRPLGAAEDLGRELVRSLDSSQLAAALISPAAPLDNVTGNRPRVSVGDEPLRLSQIWRGVLPEAMAARMDERTAVEVERLGLRPEHVEALRFSASPKGIMAASLRPDQQELLRAVLDTYVGRMPDDLASTAAARYAGDGLAGLGFAWAGGREPGEPHYYRVQGPRLLVEYDNTQNDVNHIHAVWRDPEGDFGHDVLAAHYRDSGHHH